MLVNGDKELSMSFMVSHHHRLHLQWQSTIEMPLEMTISPCFRSRTPLAAFMVSECWRLHHTSVPSWPTAKVSRELERLWWLSAQCGTIPRTGWMSCWYHQTPPPQPTTTVTTNANGNQTTITVPAVEPTVATAVNAMAPSTQEWKLWDGALAGAIYIRKNPFWPGKPGKLE